MRSALDAANAKVASLSNEGMSLRAALDAATAKAVLLSNEGTSLRSALEAANAKAASLSTESATLSSALDAANAKAGTLSNEGATLRTALTAATAQAATLRDEGTGLRSALDGSNDRIRSLESELAERKSRFTIADGEIARLKADLGAVRSRISMLDDQGNGLRVALDAATGRAKSLDAYVAGLRSSLSIATGAKESLEKQRLEWTGKFRAWETESAELRAERDSLRAKLPEPESAPVIAAAVAAGAGGTTVSKPAESAAGDIENIEGIGPVYGTKLRGYGIAYIRTLLAEGRYPEGRTAIAENTGIRGELILKWVNMADLLRITGVTPDWAELLEESGIDTVKELRRRLPENLQSKMVEVNEVGHFARQIPDLDTVRKWVEEANQLIPKVTH